MALVSGVRIPGRMMSDGNWGDLGEAQRTISIADNEFQSLITGLKERGLVERGFNNAVLARQTRDGIRHVEEQKVAADALIERNQNIRRIILEYLTRWREQNHGASGVFAEHIKRDSDSGSEIPEDDFVRNIGVLVADGLVVETIEILPLFAITSEGLAYALRQRVLQRCQPGLFMNGDFLLKRHNALNAV